MGIAQALTLGIVQGVTEFLPISSSGHLVLLQHSFNLTESMVFFDVLVHTGTLAAVLVFLRKDLLQILRSLTRRETRGALAETGERNVVLLILAALLPTALVGGLLFTIKHLLFNGVVIPAAMLIGTGFLLWSTARPAISNKQKSPAPIDFKRALLIGLAQGIAIIPGVSRSGATISTALLLGVEQEKAFRFSFLLFIPTVIAALLMETHDATLGCSLSLPVCAAGIAASFATGLAALFLLQRILRKGKLAVFAWYCWILGGAILVFKIAQLMV
jgi:undecaprenyl-diphosphatase